MTIFQRATHYRDERDRGPLPRQCQNTVDTGGNNADELYAVRGPRLDL